MMGIVVSETCWVYKKYNKIISGISLVFILQLSVYILCLPNFRTFESRHNIFYFTALKLP